MKIFYIVSIVLLTAFQGCAQKTLNSKKMENKDRNKSYNPLTPEEAAVIIGKGTERPFIGQYNDFSEKGTYVCKQCDAPLYLSSDKFKSECGWPSFDDEIAGAVRRIADPDGRRIEIVCSNCGGHLGHVFTGEGFTEKDVRHCVNSISMKFVPEGVVATRDTAIFAGGCFWGVEYYMQNVSGVISTEVGYIGGDVPNPTYKAVCDHKTGHAEAVRIIFDPGKTNYKALAKLFFEIHDPTQLNQQGPDIGEQYRSAVFYLNEDQKEITTDLIGQLTRKGFQVATEVVPATTFWKAEAYHQQYYDKKNGTPYCHSYKKKFDD